MGKRGKDLGVHVLFVAEVHLHVVDHAGDDQISIIFSPMSLLASECPPAIILCSVSEREEV